MIQLEKGRYLKPGYLIRLINSTEIGSSMTRARLREQQDRAGFRIGDENKIDVWAYSAWLAGELENKAKAAGQASIGAESDLVIESRDQALEKCYDWILEGRSTKVIVETLNEKWKTDDNAEILGEAWERIRNNKNIPDRETLTGWSFEVYRKIYNEMMKNKNYSGALRVVDAMNNYALKLGILIPKEIGDGELDINDLLA